MLESSGRVDDRGSSFLDIDGAVVDPRNDEPILSIKRECRVGQALDEEVAEEVLKSLGLYEKCLTTITVLDEDAILALNFSGDLSDEELQSIYTTSEPTFALRIYREDA